MSFCESAIYYNLSTSNTAPNLGITIGIVIQTNGFATGANGTYNGNDDELNNPALEATVWGLEADPDGASWKNWLEYATGTNPRVTVFSPEIISKKTIDDADFLTITFQKNLAATDTVLRAQAATTLLDFGNITDILVFTSGQIETRKASVPFAGFPRRFLLIKAEAAPN